MISKFGAEAFLFLCVTLSTGVVALPVVVVVSLMETV